MITYRIYEWARSQPKKTAFIFNDQIISYTEFANAIEAARSFFERQNLPVGQTAIVLSYSHADNWVLVMALRALGLHTVCVQSVAEAEALKLRNLVGIVVPELEQESLKLSGTSLLGINVILVPRAIYSNIRTDNPPLRPDHAPPFGAHILLTSGTTGTYKKVVLGGDYEDKRNAARAQAYPMKKDVIYHGANFGLWTTIGFRLPSAVWHVGGCVVIDGRKGAFDNFFRHAIDFTILIPPMLKTLVQSLGPESTRNNCELQITASFLPMDLAEETVRRVTSRVSMAYGSTELATPAMLSRYGAEDEIYWYAPAADRTIRIIDENGDDCPTNQEGELCVLLRDTDCASYLDDQEASAKVFRDGFFCPGDMAVRRADGRIRILGRSADVLNVQGRKMAMAPIELEIQHTLGVDEVCLFSGLNKAGKEELVVAIQSDRELPRSVLQPIASKFPSFERVRFTVLKEFPRTATGTRKTRRPILRKMVFP